LLVTLTVPEMVAAPDATTKTATCWRHGQIRTSTGSSRRSAGRVATSTPQTGPPSSSARAWSRPPCEIRRSGRPAACLVPGSRPRIAGFLLLAPGAY